MKRYKCHKEVEAAKILEIVAGRDHASLRLDDGSRCFVSSDNPQFSKAEIGGYLVKYADGYVSYSPAKAFEEGYTEIPVSKEF